MRSSSSAQNCESERLICRCSRCGSALDCADTLLEQQFDKRHATLTPSVTQTQSVKADGENRLVTVLSVDMSNSVKMARDLDAEDTAELENRLLSAILEVLSGYECGIDRVVGNQVMAVFGVPHAHEDDATRALSAAINLNVAINPGLSIKRSI